LGLIGTIPVFLNAEMIFNLLHTAESAFKKLSTITCLMDADFSLFDGSIYNKPLNFLLICDLKFEI
jgi:hypothetical protein